MHQLTTGDLAYWLNDQRQAVRVRVELVTRERVYLRATANDYGVPVGTVWFESRYTRRVAPRAAVYLHGGKGFFDTARVAVVE
ncbi:hypothetical protein ABZ754_13770 [Micromonospora purpureochromogenes]|uniref:hypothetical protein n=1 Tax=Micromonospora purpureochromogenes TaxID=47872 RepID=UPI00340BE2A3